MKNSRQRQPRSISPDVPPKRYHVIKLIQLIALLLHVSHAFLPSRVCPGSPKASIASSRGLNEKTKSSLSLSASRRSSLNYPDYEKHNAREMDWLLRTTTQILCDQETLPPRLLQMMEALMRSWTRRASIPKSNAAHVVERLMERLLKEREAGNELGIEIDTNIYNLVIEAWSKSSRPSIVSVKQKSREEGEEIGESNSNGGEEEGGRAVESISTISAAQRAHDILNKMQDMARLGHVHVKPDTKSYFLVLKAWVKSRDPEGIDNMKLILDQMEQEFEQYPNGNVCPEVKCYDIYLYALANSNSKNPKATAELAHSVLDHLIARYDELGDSKWFPDVNSYNQVIAAYVKMNNAQGSHRAQAIFDAMISSANSEDPTSLTYLHPNTDTFNALMSSWLRSGTGNASQRIERLLDQMNELYYAGHSDIKPDLYSVNTAITSIAKSKRKDSLRRAESILSCMENEYGIEPDATSYNLVIDAYAKSRDLRAGLKAMKLLSSMEEAFVKGDSSVMPNAFTYSTVIDALAKRKNDSGKKAEAVLGRMENLFFHHGGQEPNTAVYNAVINAWAIPGDERARWRSQAILKHMEQQYRKGKIRKKPNIISFNTVLKSYSTAKNHTNDAEELLDRMEGLHAEGAMGIVPDSISYTTVITTYARSNEPGKARSAERILLRMIDAYKSGNRAAKPVLYSFNACLNACAHTFNRKDKVDAFRVVVSTLLLLQEYTKPDHTTYGTLLKAWSILIPKDDERRSRIVSSVFRQCCLEGQVGTMVLNQLRFAASPELYKTLIGKTMQEEVTLKSIPSRWSRNVKERQR